MGCDSILNMILLKISILGSASIVYSFFFLQKPAQKLYNIALQLFVLSQQLENRWSMSFSILKTDTGCRASPNFYTLLLMSRVYMPVPNYV